ncbi:hypothetical protein KI688_008722 [Linnemannia hyalina]|uniref:Uncharacterized protein n=1 Tax=Linnemannia hyalina TaxID=64524 RepID=A0A9P7Y1T3_9FUNG|nr:hypothetical protein KI688_008722 [Linnemannia hyalina]
MFGIPSGIVIPGPGYIPEDQKKNNKSDSIRSGTSHSDILFGAYNSNSSITTATSNSTDATSANGQYGHFARSGSISSVLSGGNGPPSPTTPFNGVGNNPYYRGPAMASLAEEEMPPPYISQHQIPHHHQQHQQPPSSSSSSSSSSSLSSSEDYRQCLQWLQQTCRPVFMKELAQLNTVPVPITVANAKHPSQIGGTQLVQIASWKQSQVQVLPIDRWGQAHDVLEEIAHA